MAGWSTGPLSARAGRFLPVRSAAMDGKATLVGINHVALEVGDLDAALDLYGRLFAFEMRGRLRKIAFIEMRDLFSAAAEGRSQEADDGRHFGLVVDDVDAAREA